MGIFMAALVIASISLAIDADQRICWFTSPAVSQLAIDSAGTEYDYGESDYGAAVIQGANQTCSETSNYCYALWKEVQQNSSGPGILILARGCWESSGKQDCENISCFTTRKPPKALNNTNFCCCKGNFCNSNMTQLYYPDDIQVSNIPRERILEKWQFLLAVFVLVFFVLVATCLPFFIALARGLSNTKGKKAQFHPDSIHLVENEPACDPKYTNKNIKLAEIIGQGRYGAVWKATARGEEIAVKIFHSHHKNYFYNELDIYCTPFMKHSSLLTYLGHDERMGVDGNPEYMLFLSYIPNGNLHDFLISNVLDWDAFCRMCLSIARGIAHLHSDVTRGGQFKPCVGHRDLNTKNILIRQDFTCVICDLAFATKITGSKFYCNGEDQSPEIKTINDVGTLRYMSPEILEGAVNLRDCETAFKQIDVYALGLILWEIATRCAHFYPPGLECAPHRLPFQPEVAHPTFEQMQLLVCKHKARPLFPALWKDSPLVRSIKETIEDCWDQDAEARLTALCVQERFHEFSAMSERQKASLYSTGISLPFRTTLLERDSPNVLVIPANKNETLHDDTMTYTSAPETPLNEKSNHSCRDWPPLTVQPHQGRNPCLERNLMVLSDPESDQGTFVDKSRKCIASDPPPLPPPNPTTGNTRTNPAPRTNAPIPFVQNVRLHRSSQLVKHSNVPTQTSSRPGIIARSKWRRLFSREQLPRALSPQVDCDARTNLISHEKSANLSSPVAPKLDTRVFLHNGNPTTKLNLESPPHHSQCSGSPSGTEMDLFAPPQVTARSQTPRPDSLPLKNHSLPLVCLSPVASTQAHQTHVLSRGTPSGEARTPSRFSLVDDRIMSAYNQHSVDVGLSTLNPVVPEGVTQPLPKALSFNKSGSQTFFFVDSYERLAGFGGLPASLSDFVRADVSSELVYFSYRKQINFLESRKCTSTTGVDYYAAVIGRQKIGTGVCFSH